MSDHPWSRSEPWHDDELEDYYHAKNDDERRQMLLIFGVDEAHRRDAELLFSPPPVPEPEPPSAAERIESELKNLSDQMSDYAAKHDEEKRSDQLQAIKDKKQSFRHDFKVAVFSAAIVYALDHHQEIFDFILEIFRHFSQ